MFGSNGTLITDEVARKLKEAGACSMGISIDSLDAAKHDAFRGVAGAPRRHPRGHRGMQARGPRLPDPHHRGQLEP